MCSETNFLDVVIPCGQNDLSFVSKVIDCILLNVSNVNYIYVVTKSNYVIRLRTELCNRDNIVVLDEDKLIDGVNFSFVKKLMNDNHWYEGYGWIYQQMLKFAFALSPYAKEYYLSWDADTLPLNKLSFFKDNKPIFTVKTEYHRLYFDTIEKLLGVGKIKPYSFIAEHMVFKTEFVKELISEIEHCEVNGSTWIEKCINACEFSQTEVFSEFELYGTFVSTFHPEFYCCRTLRTFRNGGIIRGRHINREMLDLLSFDFDIVSFEYKAQAPFPYCLDGFLWREFRRFAKWKNMPFSEIPKQLFAAIKKRL